MKRRIGDIIGVCFISAWLLVILLFEVSALLGLITGEIYLPDKKGHGGTLHGATARIISLIILVICTFILSALWRGWRRRPVVHPMDLPIDKELERMRERKRRQAEERAGIRPEVERRKTTDDVQEKGAP